MVIAFLSVVTFVVVVVHSYLWWRLVRSTTDPGRWRRVGTSAIVVLALLVPGTLVVGRAAPAAVAVPVQTVGYLWLATMFYLLVYLLVFELPRVGVALAARKGLVSPGRRRFLARSFSAAAGVLAVGTVAYGSWAARRPQVLRVPITLKKLDPALNGFRIGVLADIHLSPTVRKPFLADIVRRVNELDVDLVAIVGDLVDGDVSELGPDAAALRDLRSREGTYFVTGNHEYFSGVAQWVAFLPTLGVTVLHNQRVSVTRGGASFDLAGIDDRTAELSGVPGQGADLAAALAGRDTDVPVVLLAHQPVQFLEAAERGVDLQLSGHTHGGQLMPFNLLVPLDQPFVAGMGRVGDSQIYVTRGVGTWGPRVRVGAPPEITVIELRAQS